LAISGVLSAFEPERDEQGGVAAVVEDHVRRAAVVPFRMRWVKSQYSSSDSPL
jgi:hypothetical protein